jgi:hypothetical protein
MNGNDNQDPGGRERPKGKLYLTGHFRIDEKLKSLFSRWTLVKDPWPLSHEI